MAGSIRAQDLKALLDSQTLYAVIDVRDWGEFSLGQIPGTNCIPRGSLEKYISVLAPKTDIHTVLYCPELRKRGLAREAYTPGTLRRKIFGDDRLPSTHPATAYRGAFR